MKCECRCGITIGLEELKVGTLPMTSLEILKKMPNVVVDILEKKYLIRKEEHSDAQLYELTYDRLIEPILDSNKNWKSHSFRSFRQRFKQRFRA